MWKPERILRSSAYVPHFKDEKIEESKRSTDLYKNKQHRINNKTDENSGQLTPE